MTRSAWTSKLWTLTRWGLGAALIGLVTFAVAFDLVASMERFRVGGLTATPEPTTRFFDRDGRLLREKTNAQGLRHTWVPLEDISPWVITSTIAIEDQRFHDHSGVDWVGVLRASLGNVQHGRVVSGASTLSMQLVRLLEPHPPGLLAKVREAIDARRLENHLSKDQILEHYLNRAPYGAGTVGIQAASRRYFGKDAHLLSLAEAALLAGLPKAPTSLNPRLNFPAAKARQGKVLRRLLKLGLASQSVIDLARAQKVTLSPQVAPPTAMHFTDWLHSRGHRGLVRSTLDAGLQQEAESHMTQHLRVTAGLGATHAGIVVVENANCEVRAMVGSTDYWSRTGGAVNATTSLRQPGSTLKPFTYALAWETGSGPSSPVADIPVTYDSGNGGLYRPRNFHDRFSGPVSMGEALGRSLNIPAIRTARVVGVDRLLGLLRKSGIHSLKQDANYYGLGLTLGGGEVTLLELTQAYAMLARGGIGCEAHGKTGEFSGGDRVLHADVSELVRRTLSDESLRMEAFGPANALSMDRPTAVKTGTSSNWRDNWAIGYTAEFTVGVWVGNIDGSPMQGMSGVRGAGPLFRRLLENLPSSGHAGAETGTVREASLCALSGKRPGPACPHVRTRSIRLGRLANLAECQWHQRVEVDQRNGLLAGPGCPSAHVKSIDVTRLPPEYAQWEAGTLRPRPPTRHSPLCAGTTAQTSAARILSPRSGDEFVVDPNRGGAPQRIRLRAQAPESLKSVRWVLDGRAIGQTPWPYSRSWVLSKGPHTLQIVAGGTHSREVHFVVK